MSIDRDALTEAVQVAMTDTGRSVDYRPLAEAIAAEYARLVPAEDAGNQPAFRGNVNDNPTPAEDERRLRELIRELAVAYHQTGSIRDHADPNDKTGWHVKGIETCADPLCVDALAATPEPR